MKICVYLTYKALLSFNSNDAATVHLKLGKSFLFSISIIDHLTEKEIAVDLHIACYLQRKEILLWQVIR